MAKTLIPVFQLGDHCEPEHINNFEMAPFSSAICTAAEFLEHHRHDYYEIIWLKKGKGTHFVDSRLYAYNGPVMFLLSPGQIHKLQQQEKAEGYIIKFLPAIFRDQKDIEDFILNTGLFDNVQANPVIDIPPAAMTSFEELLLKMNAEFINNETDKEQVLSAYLKILMTQVNRLKRNGAPAQQNTDVHFALFTQYKIAVEKKFRQQHSVQGYADQLHVQGRTLNTLSKKYAGKSAGEIITDRIILEAKRYLYHNAESVKEIAWSLGFDDPAYFTRFFKKQTGISPQQYRENKEVA